jgi:hypothetical protein
LAQDHWLHCARRLPASRTAGGTHKGLALPFKYVYGAHFGWVPTKVRLVEVLATSGKTLLSSLLEAAVTLVANNNQAPPWPTPRLYPTSVPE